MPAKRVALCTLATIFAFAACSTSGKSATPTTVGCPNAAPLNFGCHLNTSAKEKYGWYDLGVVAQRDQDFEKAAGDYLRAIAIGPKFEPALYNLAVIRLQSRQYTAAVTLLDRAVAANPKDAKAFEKLAVALVHLHTAADDARAKVALNKSLALDPPSRGFPQIPTEPTRPRAS